MMMMMMIILFLFKADLQVLHMRFRVCENIMKWHEIKSINDWRTISVMVKCQNFNNNRFLSHGKKKSLLKVSVNLDVSFCIQTWGLQKWNTIGPTLWKWTKMNFWKGKLLSRHAHFGGIFSTVFLGQTDMCAGVFFWIICGFGLLENLEGLRGGDWNNSRVRYSQGVGESQRSKIIERLW